MTNHIYFLHFLKADSESVKIMINNQIIQVRSPVWCGRGCPGLPRLLSATLFALLLLLQVEFDLAQLVQSKSDQIKFLIGATGAVLMLD